MSVNKERGFVMKTAGKSLFKMLLSFTVAISCLIGIGMTSLADTHESLSVGQILKNGDTLTSAEGVGYYIGGGSTQFFHEGVVYTVFVGEDNKDGKSYYGFKFTYNSVPQEILITTAPADEGATGIKVVSGDGNANAFQFKTYNPATEKGDEVIEMINALPDPADVTAYPACSEPIEAARAAYDELDEAMQAYVGEDNLATLEACENALKTAQEDKAAADKVQALVDELPEPEDITEEDRADLEKTRKAYDGLSASQQQYVNINKLLADEQQIDKNKAAIVMDLIDAIGEVDSSDACGDRIRAAREAYNALTGNQKRYVDNFNDMTAAEEKYLSMVREAVIKDIIEKINAIPAADKLTIADFYEVYDPAYDFNNNLTEEEQAGFDADAKKKLDESEKIIFSLFYEAGQQLLDDYGDTLKTLTDLEDGESDYDYLVNTLKKYESAVASGKTPSYAEFDDLIWTVILINYDLYDFYTVTEGADAVWTVGSTDSLVFRILQAGIKDKRFDRTFRSFTVAGGKIYIDGKLTESEFIKAEEGSVIITIMPEFLKTLSTGEHTLTVLFDDSVTVDIKFTIKPAASVPASGESLSHYVILGVSVILLAGAVLTLRKHMVDSVK